MFNDNSAPETGRADQESVPSSGSKIKELSTPAPVTLSEEDAIDLIGNWNLMAAFALLDLPEFQFNTENVSKKLNLSMSEAQNVIDSLLRIGVIAQRDDGCFVAAPLFISNSIVSSADLLSIFNRLSHVVSAKLTAKDSFGYQFESMSPKVIKKYLPEIYSVVRKIAEESKVENDCEVYAYGFSFTKASRSRKDK